MQNWQSTMVEITFGVSSYVRIYNSRNYIWLIAKDYETEGGEESTIVEITFGL